MCEARNTVAAKGLKKVRASMAVRNAAALLLLLALLSTSVAVDEIDPEGSTWVQGHVQAQLAELSLGQNEGGVKNGWWHSAISMHSPSARRVVPYSIDIVARLIDLTANAAICPAGEFNMQNKHACYGERHSPPCPGLVCRRFFNFDRCNSSRGEGSRFGAVARVFGPSHRRPLPSNALCHPPPGTNAR